MDSNRLTKDCPQRIPVVSKMKFDKKKWRQQRYSAKSKVQNWENIQRRQTLRKFNKELKKIGDSVVFNKKAKYKNESSNNLKEAQEYYQNIKQKKERKRKEVDKLKKEKIEAIKAYKEKKAMRYRKLSQKTKKGQPLMKGRIELLLEKIQTEYSCDNNK